MTKKDYELIQSVIRGKWIEAENRDQRDIILDLIIDLCVEFGENPKFQWIKFVQGCLGKDEDLIHWSYVIPRSQQ